jgi:hypothetical protein
MCLCYISFLCEVFFCCCCLFYSLLSFFLPKMDFKDLKNPRNYPFKKMIFKHSAMHPAPKQEAWLNHAAQTGGGATNPWVRITNPWVRIAKAWARFMNLWVQIQQKLKTRFTNLRARIGTRGYGLLIRGHELLNQGNSIRIRE